MTIKLQRSINPSTIAPHNINPLSTIRHPCSPELGVGLPKPGSLSMDRMQEFKNIESVRKTILMQEGVFKQQVQELHRIYNLQKKLMQELENGLKRTTQTDRTDSGIVAAWNQTERETGRGFQAFAARDDPKEVSGSCSGETSRMPIKFDLEIPAETTAPSDVHTFEERKELKMMDEESDVEVELTLSIGHGTRKQRSNNQVGEVGSSSTRDEYREPGSITSSTYQENTRPHWLLQDLSLNRT
ncbi:hypothetical protein Salat_2639300 [Sesamum alatum]|uniref:Uncharacterized protein n=1 Tax=Sesamum alatum TaxID=300844 RepID=A0AAE1XPP3_9LAMI|nr:hypothetical protein Salat_2639300 [Sesamum alatum]